MRNAALKKELEDVIAAWPAIPAFDLSRIANDNEHHTVTAINRYAKQELSEMELWRVKTLKVIGKWEDLLGKAEKHGDKAHVQALIEVMHPVQQRIETTTQKLISSLQPDSEVYLWLRVLKAFENKEANAIGNKIERRYRELIRNRLRINNEFKHHLMRVIWDHDPDARGGPKFEKADDLIAFLES